MIEFRAATEDDLPDIHRVWWAADPFKEFSHNPWFDHVLRTGTMMVASAEGRLVGFAGVRRVGETTVVSDCFVDPDHQARGVGTGLLSRILSPERPVMTLASQDPKARSLYARFGMAPKWECHYVEGSPAAVDGGGSPAAEVGGYPVADSDLPHLREGLGCRFVATRTGSAAIAVESIESSIVLSSEDAAPMLTAALGWMAASAMHLAKVHLSDLHPAFPLLVGSGFTITDADTLMAGPGAEVPDPTRITFNGDILRLSY
jgi:GNAT superfamily N-acetyltransferase